MKALIVSLVFLFSWTLLAAPQNYKIDLELKIDGELVSKPSITTLGGTQATVAQTQKNGEQIYIQVTPDEGEISDIKGILMKMEVGQRTKDGKQKVLAKPTLLSKDGGVARVILSNNKTGESEVEIKAIATRVH